MSTTDWVLLMVLSVLWGGAFFFNEIALRELPVLSVVAGRVSIAAIVLWVVALVRGHQFPRNARLWLWFLIMGLANNVLPFSFIVFGQTTITAGLASILNATTPFFIVIIIALFVRDEAVSKLKIAGLVVGFLGVVVMLGPDILGIDSASLLGQFAVLCAALSYAIAGIYGRRFQSAGISPILAAAGQVTMSAILLIPTALAIDGMPNVATISGTTWMSIAGLALFSTALAYIIYFKLLSSAGAVNVMLVTLLIPVSALLLGTFLLNEPVRPLEIIGMTIIGAALIIIDGRLLTLKKN
jgi:drug/metabolite transporter (DMT)-like permease